MKGSELSYIAGWMHGCDAGYSEVWQALELVMLVDNLGEVVGFSG
jgi:hypothetical protein